MRTPIIALAALAVLGAAAVSTAFGQDDFHTFHGPQKGEPKLDYDALAAAATPLEDSPRGRALADACLARYGGVEKLQGLRGLRLVYRTKSMGGTDEEETVKTFERGRKYRVRTPRQTRVLNGDRAWFRNADTQIDLDGGRYRAELFSWLTLAMPLALTDERYDGGVRYGEREGDPLGYFYMEKKDSLMIILGVDPADSLIKSSEGVIRQEGESFVFINRFSQHRDVDGFPFADQLVNVSLGLEVGRSRLESVEVNPEFDADEFTP